MPAAGFSLLAWYALRRSGSVPLSTKAGRAGG